MNAGGAQQRLQVPCVEAVGGTHRQWHVDTMPNNRMNLTGIPLRSIPAGYPQRSAAISLDFLTVGGDEL